MHGCLPHLYCPRPSSIGSDSKFLSKVHFRTYSLPRSANSIPGLDLIHEFPFFISPSLSFSLSNRLSPYNQAKGDVNNRANSGPKLLLRLFLLLIYSSFSYSTHVHASYIGLDLRGNAVILSDAGKNVSFTGKSIFANGMDLGLLYSQVQQLQQAMTQQHESLLSLQATVVAQQQNITQQQSVIEHQQEIMAAQNSSLSSLQSIVNSQQQTIAQLQLTLTMVTGCALPRLNSSLSNFSSSLCNCSSNNSCFSSTIPDIQAGLSQLNKSVSSLSQFATEINRNVSIISTHTVSPPSLQNTMNMQENSLSQVDEFISQLCALGSSSASNISIAMPLQEQISTNGAMDWEFFTIGSTSYLAVANYYNSDSNIYRFDETQSPGSQFVQQQQISTNGAWDWEFFLIGDTSYLAVANYYNGNTYNIPSDIYRFDETQPPGSQFVLVQQISTIGAQDWEFFAIGDTSYLAVANSFDGNSHNIPSNIYRFDETQPAGSQFVLVEQISTNGAVDWEFFTIGDISFLAVANWYNDNSYNIPSNIYRVDETQPPGTQFVLVQQIYTIGAYDWEFFTIGNSSYLAVANYQNGNTFIIPSNIYRFDETQPPGSQFVLVQQISTNGARDWEFFTIGNSNYLAVANWFNGNTFIIPSNIYRVDETQPPGSQFALVQQIPTNGATDWEYFTIGNTSYLAIANEFNGNSHNIPSNIYGLVHMCWA